MIYMVEMDMNLGDREAEWHEWYLAHIKTLLTVPGFRGSQRFKSMLPTAAPFLALHEVDSAAVLDSEEYRSRGGPGSTGEWRTLHTNWRRNLLDGLGQTPDVPMDSHLLVLDGVRNPRLPAGIAIGWLTSVGLDRSIERCGLGLVKIPHPMLIDMAKNDPRIRLYKPMTPKMREAS